MANTITGRVIAVSTIENIPSKKEQGKTFQRRQLFIDCTRYDPYTGERGFENTPLLEFGGKGLEQLNALVDKGLKKGDIVTVTFDINDAVCFTSINKFLVKLIITCNKWNVHK